MSEPPLRAEEILGVLEAHRVDYVLVGGYAAQLHGSPERTRDVDVVPATTSENLQRLVDALKELGARVRTEVVPEGLPFAISAQALASMTMLNLVTAYGEVDLTFTPSGTRGYPDLVRGAGVLPVGMVQVRVASLADVIRSKEAAGRGKDLRVLPGLRRLAQGLGPSGQRSGREQPDAEVGTQAGAAPTAARGEPDPLDVAPALTPEETAAARPATGLSPAERIAAARAEATARREQQRRGRTDQ